MSGETNPYISVFRTLHRDSSIKVKNGFKMLETNYLAEDMTITASELASAIGYDSHSIANEQYGSFAHKVSDLLGREPENDRNGQPIWTFILCDMDGTRNSRGHLHWTLKREVADALEELGMVSPKINSNIFLDVEKKEKELAGLEEKYRESVIQARIGQGAFRKRVISYWGGCAVTGVKNTEFLIASHIKPWRDCSPAEAIDLTNGLLLIPNLDRVFDSGYISFDENGAILISSFLSNEDLVALSIERQLTWPVGVNSVGRLI